MYDEFLDSVHGVSHWWLVCAQSIGLRRSRSCSSCISVADYLYTDRGLLFYVYNVNGEYWVNSWTVWILGHYAEHYTTHSCYTYNTPEFVSVTRTVSLYVACFSVLKQDITVATIKRVEDPCIHSLAAGSISQGHVMGCCFVLCVTVSYFFWGMVLTTNYGASRRFKCY